MDNEFLTKEVADDETFEVLKQMVPMKAPGLDGMQAIYYEKSWNIVVKLVLVWLEPLSIQFTCFKNQIRHMLPLYMPISLCKGILQRLMGLY